ncbi:LamG domain-containing protein [Dinghuibacter silviterrae]|uniref:Concanavalin A-like lectin/glucanase superfamily protein n=1 Tax=Dinghuibacter silviterrae TaxID=1539049 RepID=A0A4R8DHI1_9BACT|nr:LamG domain-containing protein [Dinghuibacter silviterrae]TDW97181.1 concanavalin A-like lectin/glucanase superfamily protein [Dinghuibacter silviterrae]
MTYKKLSALSGILIVMAAFLVNSCTKSSSNPTSTTDTTVNLTKGLLLYLPFSGNIADSSGNNNPTTAIGSVLTYDAHGYANNAFGATGNGERVIVTNNGSIKFDTAYSLSFGVMVNDNRPEYYIAMVNPTVAKGVNFVIGSVVGPTTQLAMGTEDTTVGCEGNATNDALNKVDSTGFIPVPGAWYNVIGIYHKGLIQVYVNGQLISSAHSTGSVSNCCQSSNIVIGAWWNQDLQSLNGKLDNIRLYNRVLTPHEIAKLASNYQVTSNSIKPAAQTGSGPIAN